MKEEFAIEFREAALRHGVSASAVMGPSNTRDVAAARREAIKRIRTKTIGSLKSIATETGFSPDFIGDVVRGMPPKPWRKFDTVGLEELIDAARYYAELQGYTLEQLQGYTQLPAGIAHARKEAALLMHKTYPRYSYRNIGAVLHKNQSTISFYFGKSKK